MRKLELAEFQRATVERIYSRLRDPCGLRRFLLADEVGLGKTLVARGVIERLLTDRRTPLVVIYLCSNADIAEQNRRKLDPEAGPPLRRISELALRTGEPSSDLQLFSFTPGTSLHEGTGLAWERRLLLYLVGRVLREDVDQRRWREFFRCGVREERWYLETRPLRLEREFRPKKIPAALCDAIGDDWHRERMFDGEVFTPATGLATEVARFAADPESDDLRRRRNRMIALLRSAIQRVLLEAVDPDLVIMDEVQRFKEVLEQEKQPDSLAGRLFRRKGTKVLILSATPYRMLTFAHEAEDGGGHYDDLLKTLGFLYRGDRECGVESVRADLSTFEARLRQARFLIERDTELRQIKTRLEEKLRRVVCRTERNWYMEDVRKGVEEIFPDPGRGRLPQVEDLQEFVRLRRFLLGRESSAYRITEYWKSCPAPLTFMDSSYVVMKSLRRDSERLPKGIIEPSDSLPNLPKRNHRFRALLDLAFPGSLEPDSTACRHLWIRPTYVYYRDRFFTGPGPDKLLVFASWRFVPKAIALLLSLEVERRLRATLRGDDAQPPLRFTDKQSFHVFDVCFPSVALAASVDLAALAKRSGIEAGDVLQTAERTLRDRLEDADVVISDGGSDPLWRVVARLEAANGSGQAVVDALKVQRRADRSAEPSQYYEAHREQFLKWLSEPRRPLRLSRARLRKLSRIASFSPAVSLLRAFWSVYPESRDAFPSGLVDVCTGPLRAYLNRPLTRAIIENESREGFYTDRVLDYCRDAQVQAMLDEYVFLLCDVERKGTAGDAIRHIGEVLDLGAGTPRINTLKRSSGGAAGLTEDGEQKRAHFALAFGEEVSGEQALPGEAAGAFRRAHVRAAFNSPFWPFVLATTSVGQEGLDLHLYCRDIVHWNLPSNPVDLEQREGRINRRDGIAIRRSIAADFPLPEVARRAPDAGPSRWSQAFAAAAKGAGLQRYKHGLFPHWVYESDGGRPSGIRRHLLFYEHSADATRYERLRTGLVLYRLVFGQPRQEDLLAHLERRMQDSQLEGAASDFARTLPAYMINLSPFDQGYAWERAEMEAAVAIGDPAAIWTVVSDVERIAVARGAELHGVLDQLRRLIDLVQVERPETSGDRRKLLRALTVLIYLRNPYDAEFDSHVSVGLEDDAMKVRLGYEAVFGDAAARKS